MRRSVPVRLALALVAAVAAPGLAATARLPTDVVPRAQAVELRTDPASDRYSGSVAIELEAVRPAARFALHARGETIEALRLRAGERELPVEWSVDPETEQLVVTPGEPLEPGRLDLEIDFSQSYNRRSVGLYKSEVGGTPYLFTQFQAVDAREAFPCWDEPAFKIPFQVTVTHPDGLVAISNQPVESESVADGWRRVEFRATPPLSSYLVALAVGPFDLVDVEGGSVPIRVVTTKGQGDRAGFALEEAAPILASAERWFGTPYPFEKLDLVAVPDFAYGAMENPGAITFRDELLLVDVAQLSANDRRRAANIIAHEIAHMWFGDMVTMEWWTEFWLNESFAEWAADKIAGAVHPGEGGERATLEQVEAVMRSDASASAFPIQLPPGSGPEDAFATVGIAYGKGKGIFDMVEAWVGEEPFREGVVAYLEKHAWGSTLGADLWAALDRVTGKNVSAVLRTFVEQPSYPLVDVEASADGAVRLRQSRYVAAGVELPALTWRVPMELVWGDDAGTHRRIVLLEGPTAEVRLPVDGRLAWILPDGGARGYYRWRLPDAALEALFAHAGDALSTLERARLLDDLAALLEADAIDGGTYVRRVAEFVADPAPEVAASALRQVGSLAPPFQDDPAFAGFVRAALAPVAARALSQPEAETPAEADLREIAFRMLGFLGRSEDAIRRGREVTNRFLADPASADPTISETALYLAAYNGDEALWTRFREAYEATEDPQLATRLPAALAAFDDDALVARALDYAFTDHVAPSNRAAVLFIAGVSGDEGKLRLADWLFAHWDDLSSSIPPYLLAESPRLFDGGCSAELKRRVTGFWEPKLTTQPQFGRALQRTVEQIDACLSLREREEESVSVTLRELAGSGSGAIGDVAH